MNNQCDGCRQGAPINANGNHTDKDGRAFMGCQKARYQDGWWESAVCLACGAKARSAHELPCGH
ncbi:MAG TPA: hypothetical protein VF534_27250 [Paraburkholderia sp.]